MSRLCPRSASVLGLLLAVLPLLACSAEEGRRPEGGGKPAKSARADGGGQSFGGKGEPVARVGGSVKVERAILSSAGDADLVQARVGYRGSWVWPRCALLEGPDVETVRGTIEGQKPPRDEGFTRALWEEGLWREHESLWADSSTIEKSLQDGGVVIWTFHEDSRPEGEAADPRRTPFFVRCAGGIRPTSPRTRPTSWGALSGAPGMALRHGTDQAKHQGRKSGPLREGWACSRTG